MIALENAYGLVIGIANYENARPLPIAVLNDVHDIYTVLTSSEYCAYIPENVELLLDNMASKQGIIQGLIKLAKRSNQDSTIFIYISSHGERIENGPYAGEYLLPVDANPINEQLLAETAISSSDFTNALNAIQASKVIVIFDCCHSGGIGQIKGISEIKNGLSNQYYEALKAGRGRVIIASSRDTEYSHILPHTHNSLFTTHFLAGLQGKAHSDDGLIRIFNLFEYLQPLVVRDVHDQHPIFKSSLEENFPIGLYMGKKQKKNPPSQGNFLYDVYISYVDKEPDATWVWKTLLPRLKAAHLKIAISNDVEEPGVARLISIERAIKLSERIVIVLSPAYLSDYMSDFQNVLAQTLGIQEGKYRLLPIKIAPIKEEQLPIRLSMLAIVDLSDSYKAKREFTRLITALRGPLPSQ